MKVGTTLRTLIVTGFFSIVLSGCGSSGEITSETGSSDSNESSGSADGSAGGNASGSDGGAQNPDNNTTTNNDRPNIILVITDDQGLDASAQYSLSNDLPVTPVIDSLAANGITFDNVWATPSCTTTRAALLTGKHGVNNGVTTTPGILSPSVGTVQQYLQQNAPDYATAVFGKWHVAGTTPDVNHPGSLGVQYYAGNLTGNLTDYYSWQMTVNGVQSIRATYHTTAIVDDAIDWIAAQNAPWFTWMAFSAPHSPWHSPPDNFNRRNLSGTEEDINANTRDYYLAALETLDSELGRLLDSLSNEERAKTIVMVIGDNGTPAPVIDSSFYARTHSKGSLFEGGVKVPLVVSGYGVDRTNVREAGLVSIVDFFPTIAALAGGDNTGMHDGYSLLPSFSEANSVSREYLYTEYLSDRPLGSGWTVRSDTHKYIAYADGTEAFYNLVADPDEASNLLPVSGNALQRLEALRQFGLTMRNESIDQPVGQLAELDITNRILDNNSSSCADHVRSYFSTATEAATGMIYNGDLTVRVSGDSCIFSTNATPNHTFNDGANPFPNAFSAQSDEYQIPLTPGFAGTITELSLAYDDAILLNGVKIDLLAAGCFGVGNGRIGCNDDSQPWRYDPMFAGNTFRVDTHNAHTQPDGTYHYHGDPNALFDRSGNVASPVVGFAADGFPVYGSYINDNGTVRQVESSYELQPGQRPAGDGEPGGSYDGTFRDDYTYVAGSGDLDECNGMTVNGQYAYYITEEYPYVVACFKGTVDESFRK